MKTEQIKVWLNEYSVPLDMVMEKYKEDGGIANLVSYSNSDMSTAGWVQIGTADVTITLIDSSTVIGNQVQSLRNQIAELRDRTENHVQELNQQIQSLLAITCDASLVTENVGA